MFYRTDWFEVIKDKRKELKLSQQEIADEIGIQRSRLSLVESGESYLNGLQFFKLLFLLELSPLDIIDPDEHLSKTIRDFIHYSFKLVHVYQENESESIDAFINEQNDIIRSLIE